MIDSPAFILLSLLISITLYALRTPLSS
jgi:hypothetical protein